jgi:hypothetical protein
MLGKILGFADLFTGIMVVLFQYNIIPGQLVFSLAFYLILKAIIFFGDFMSMIDGIAGLYMLLMLLLKIEVVSVIFAIYLTLKGLWSLFG